MRAVRPLAFVLGLLPACDPPGTGLLHVTPVLEEDPHEDGSALDVAVDSDTGPQLTTVPLGETATFIVGAGRVGVEVSGSWWTDGGDTGGEGWECAGEESLRIDQDEVVEIEVDLDCTQGWVD